MRRLWPILGLLLVGGVGFASPNAGTVRQKAPGVGEREILTNLTHTSKYVEVEHLSSSPNCIDVDPPQAITTPNPPLTLPAAAHHVSVSFIIGTDGRVHSPLILESAGTSSDQRLLQTVRTWKYRPATCNGVPTEIEGKVEFSRK
jgi:TonB family protein